MVKPRVYGSQIVVKLFSDRDFMKPFCIDFDKMSTSKIINTDNYRTIGRTINTHQPDFEGYTITLTREKRDNYLNEFVAILDDWQKARLKFCEIVIEKTIKHSYSPENINPQSEFHSPRNSSVVEKILERTFYAVSNLLNPVKQGVNQIINNINQNPVVSSARNTVGQGLNALSLLGTLAEDNFKEKIYYTGCTLSSFTDDVENSMSTNVNQIGFNASEMFTDKSDYNSFKSYIEQVLLQKEIQLEEAERQNLIKTILKDIPHGVTNFVQTLNSASSEQITSVSSKVGQSLLGL